MSQRITLRLAQISQKFIMSVPKTLPLTSISKTILKKTKLLPLLIHIDLTVKRTLVETMAINATTMDAVMVMAIIMVVEVDAVVVAAEAVDMVATAVAVAMVVAVATVVVVATVDMVAEDMVAVATVVAVAAVVVATAATATTETVTTTTDNIAPTNLQAATENYILLSVEINLLVY